MYKLANLRIYRGSDTIALHNGGNPLCFHSGLVIYTPHFDAHPESKAGMLWFYFSELCLLLRSHYCCLVEGLPDLKASGLPSLFLLNSQIPVFFSSQIELLLSLVRAPPEQPRPHGVLELMDPMCRSIVKPEAVPEISISPAAADNGPGAQWSFRHVYLALLDAINIHAHGASQ